MKAKEAGKDNIIMVYPKEGNTEVAFACAMVKNCKNPSAAQAVIDFTCSVEYLDARLDLLGASRGCNKGCKGSELCPPSSELGLIPIDLEVFTAEKKALLQKYADLWTSKYPG
jgi:ABC-type Fe3+ transport system substrate-binding protein